MSLRLQGWRGVGIAEALLEALAGIILIVAVFAALFPPPRRVASIAIWCVGAVTAILASGLMQLVLSRRGLSPLDGTTGWQVLAGRDVASAVLILALLRVALLPVCAV